MKKQFKRRKITQVYKQIHNILINEHKLNEKEQVKRKFPRQSLRTQLKLIYRIGAELTEKYMLKIILVYYCHKRIKRSSDWF